MTRDFKSEFPVKYVCAAWQLRNRGYLISPDGTNCVRKGVKKYEIISVNEQLPAGPGNARHIISPLYGMVEGRDRHNAIVDLDIARIYGISSKTIRIFADCTRGRMTHDRDTDEEVFAYHLGYFFRQNIYAQLGNFSLRSMEAYSPLKFGEFVFNARCAWFKH